MELKHESYMLIPEPRDAVAVQGEQICIPIADGAGRRTVKPAQNMQERTFSHARCADNGDHFAGYDVEIDTIKHGQRNGTGREALSEMLDADQGFYFFSPLSSGLTV